MAGAAVCLLLWMQQGISYAQVWDEEIEAYREWEMDEPFLDQGRDRDRDFVKEQIARAGECRNVAITMYGGDLVLCGRNGWAANDCPEYLTDALHGLERAGAFIEDVQLTEKGNWLIQYYDGPVADGQTAQSQKFRWSGIPRDLRRQLQRYMEDGETIYSVSFNDLKEWIIITSESFSASNSALRDWLKEANEEHGMLWTVCLTDDAVVVVCENGFYMDGEVPWTLEDALNSTEIFVRRLKIAGDSWFFSDGIGEFDYEM